MEHCSSSLSDLQPHHQHQYTTWLSEEQQPRFLQNPSLPTCLTSPSTWWAWSWTWSRWACWVGCSGSPPRPDPPAEGGLCKWTRRHGRRWPAETETGEVYNCRRTERLRPQRSTYLLRLHVAEHGDLLFHGILQSGGATTHDLEKVGQRRWGRTSSERLRLQLNAREAHPVLVRSHWLTFYL